MWPACRSSPPRGALDDGGAGLLVAADLRTVVEVADHVIPVVPQTRPLQRRSAQARDPAGGGPGLGAAQQRLGRDARPVGALAADQLTFNDRDPPARIEQPARGGLTACTHADDDHIELVHLTPPADSGFNERSLPFPRPWQTRHGRLGQPAGRASRTALDSPATRLRCVAVLSSRRNLPDGQLGLPGLTAGAARGASPAGQPAGREGTHQQRASAIPSPPQAKAPAAARTATSSGGPPQHATGTSSNHRPPGPTRCRPSPAPGGTGCRGGQPAPLPKMRPGDQQAWSCSHPHLRCTLSGSPARPAGPAAGIRRAPRQPQVTPKARAAWRRASSAALSRLSMNVPG